MDCCFKALPRGRAAPSISRLHASGARTAESVSQATTSLTVRSAIQIRADRAFKEGFAEAAAERQTPLVLATRLDLKPLDVEGGQRGIGKDVTNVWKGRLRESKSAARVARVGEPVANNALSGEGMKMISYPDSVIERVCAGSAPDRPL